jgi:protein SCO1/2
MKSKINRLIQRKVNAIAFILLVVSVVACKESTTKKQHALPFIGNYDVVTSETNGVVQVDTVYPAISKFKFLNQDSTWCTSESLKGKVWVVSFFFSSCPSICPPMMHQMKRMQQLTADLTNQVQFISFSIDPTNDTPSRLKAYAQDRGMNLANWVFLTGDETKIHALGVNEFLVHAARDQYEAGGFAHSDAIVLVDKEGHVRGVYPSNQPSQMKQLHTDIRKLLQIEYGVESTKK